MPMNNPKAEHVDFSIFEGLIPENSKWSASNIDTCFHRANKARTSDKFLFIEWKHPDERDMLPGQKILLQALSGQPNMIVLFVIGYSKPNDAKVDKIYKVSKSGLKELTIEDGQTGVEKLQSTVKVWYDWASQ
jgi:hypothetical protein